MYKVLVSFLVLAFLCVALAQSAQPRLEAVPSDSEAAALFSKFKVDFNRSYASAEEDVSRFELFKATLKQVVEQNKNTNTATFGITRFADYSAEEKKAFLGGQTVPEHEELAARNRNVSQVNPINPIDWRQRSPPTVTPVKDQGQCGACWAFGALEMVEVAWAQTQGGRFGLQTLSAQQFVDCCNSQYCGGCNGGNSAVAVEYMNQNQGGALDFDWAYPYVQRQQNCNFQGGAAIGGWSHKVNYIGGDEDSLYWAVQNSPVTIMIDANTLLTYSNGVLNAGNCDSSTLNHFVQIIGITYWSDGTPVWIVKNQWNTWWGMEGYAYIQYGQGACAVGRVSYTAINES